MNRRAKQGAGTNAGKMLAVLCLPREFNKTVERGASSTGTALRGRHPHGRSSVGAAQRCSRGWKMEKAAPWGSARTDQRPTPSRVVGGISMRAPSFAAWEAEASQLLTRK